MCFIIPKSVPRYWIKGPPDWIINITQKELTFCYPFFLQSSTFCKSIHCRSALARGV